MSTKIFSKNNTERAQTSIILVQKGDTIIILACCCVKPSQVHSSSFGIFSISKMAQFPSMRTTDQLIQLTKCSGDKFSFLSILAKNG